MNKERTILYHIGWNIRGAPDNKYLNWYRINNTQQINQNQNLKQNLQKNQQCLMFIHLLETNIKNNAKILWEGLQYNNQCTQKTAAGVSLLINDTKLQNNLTKILNKTNDQQFQIIMHIVNQNIFRIIISIHKQEQNKQQEKKLINLIDQLKQFQINQQCCQIIIFADLNEDISDNKNLINKSFTNLGYKIYTTNKPTHQRGNKIDFFIIYNNNLYDIQNDIIEENNIIETVEQMVEFQTDIQYIIENKQIYLESQQDQLKQLVNSYLNNKWQSFLGQTNQLHKENKSKIFYQNIKKIYNLTKKGEMFSLQNGLLFDQNNLPIFGEKAIEVVKDYFEKHFESNNCYLQENLKVSDEEADDFLSGIGIFDYEYNEISDGKGCSQDHIKDIIINSYTQNGQIQINNHNRVKNIKNWIKLIITNPQQYQCNYQGRQVYLQKTEDNRHPEYCRPITILPAITKVTEQKILYNINQTTKKLRQIKQDSAKGDQQQHKQLNCCHTYTFDTPSHSYSFEEVLQQEGVRNIDLKVIKVIYSNLRINGFRIGRGFLQGSPLSPKLFILYLNFVLKIVEARVREKLGLYFKLLYLAYADDLALVHDNIEELKVIDQIMREGQMTSNMKL
ncbi:hypothetical protein ABPG72_005910 [Tetrahymena utriculariae]